MSCGRNNARSYYHFAKNRELLTHMMLAAKYQLREKDPKNFRSLYYIGIVYSIQGEDDKAIDYFTQSLALNEYQSHVYYRRALAQYHKCNFELASEDLTKAHNLGLDNDDCKKLREILSAKSEFSM